MLKNICLCWAVVFAFIPVCKSAVTDNSERLIVPAGETYSLSGPHSYSAEVRIDGLLKAGAYNGTQVSGTLEISAPVIYVSSQGRITADMQGYGADSGQGKPAVHSGCSRGAGAAYGGLGGDSGAIKGGQVYGSFMTPADIGSGGGSGVCGGASGGSGGGYLKLVSSEIALYGVISSTGGSGGGAWCYVCSYDGGGGGSGGSVRLEADRLYGTGSVIANGGDASPYGGGGGAGGRILAQSGDLSSFTGKMYALGGKGGQNGGAGTVVLNGTLILDANNFTGAKTPLPAGNYQLAGIRAKNKADVEIPPDSTFEAGAGEIQSGATVKNSGKLRFSDTLSVIGGTLSHAYGNLNAESVLVGYGGQLNVDEKMTAGDLLVSSGGLITHGAASNGLHIETLRNVVVDSGGRISADGKGYGSDGGPGKPSPVSGCSNGAGGGYGGSGGDSGGLKGGAVYGAPLTPNIHGSGGGSAMCGGSGGGAGGGFIELAAGGKIAVNGSISSNGGNGGFAWCSPCSYVGGGGGSGGTVLLKAGSIEGTGIITAGGGRGGAGNNGGGGGGRISLYYGNRSLTGTVAAAGGPAGGKTGTILENGVIKSGTPPGIEATAAIAKPAEILGAQNYLTETLASSYLRLTGVPATGSISGVFNFPELEIVRLRTGVFNGRGFAFGKFSASLGGANYTGELKSAVYEKDGALFFKGALSGDVRGVIEATAGNGIFSGKVKFSGVGSQNSAGELFLSGAAPETPGAQYPATRLLHVQSNVAGDMSGYLYYSGAVNSVLDYLSVDDPANPYYGKGFLTGSFKGRLGEAMGFAYAEGAASGLAGFAGMIGTPSYGLMSGVYMGNSNPRAFALSFERIDAGLPYGMDVSIAARCPAAASPWQTITCEISLVNTGLKAMENVSLIARFPEFMDYVSASPGHQYYPFAHWIRDNSESRPYLRWDLASIPAKAALKFSYQAKMRIGPQAHEMLGSDVYLLPKDKADSIFPVYTEEDYGEDY